MVIKNGTLGTPYGKTAPPRASPPYLGPLANLANVLPTLPR